MNLKVVFTFIVIISILLSVSLVSATEINISENVSESTQIDNNFNDVQNIVGEDISSVEESVNNDFKGIDEDIGTLPSNDLKSNDDYKLYIGANNTEDGDGSPNNPFKTLDLACEDVNNGELKEKVTINMFDGTYYIGSNLIFNTPNLSINSLGNNVVIKNLYKNENAQQYIGLTSTLANLTMNNIVFDASGYGVEYSGYTYCFLPFKGDCNLVTFNNCTFTGFNSNILSYDWDEEEETDFIFNNCLFTNFTQPEGCGCCFGEQLGEITFNYCIFSCKFDNGFGFDEFGNKVTFNSIWFGENDIFSYHSYLYMSYEDWQEGTQFYGNFYFTKYAIFNVTENYIGNNQYEIMGKLMWNDTTTEGINQLGSMIVYLSSDTGDIPKTAILENGTFKVIYNSTSSNHKVTAKLDFEEINLTFSNIVLNLDAPNIVYGDDQNITITLPQKVNGAITVFVNGKPYYDYIEDSDSIIIPITDLLSVNTYEVNVTFVDEENHLYGFNTTTFIVSKVSEYDFNATINSTSVYIGDSVSITVNLPSGANGTVTVKVGDNEAKIFDVNETIIINGFVTGDNVVNITYNGNAKYDAKSIVKNVFTSLKPTTITASDISTTYNVAKDLVITLKDISGGILVNKTVNVAVGSINKNLTTDASGQASIDVSALTPNTYTATITFIGDDSCAGSNSSANVVVSKIASKVNAPAITTTYNVAKNLVITLKDNNGKVLANQKVAVKVGTISKTLTTNAKGQVSVDVSKLTPKKYTATITYKGDTINAGTSGNAKVVVNKATPKITAKKATFKAKTKTKKYTVTLKDNKGKALAKAKVTLKVKGVTYKATTNAKGKATFKITKLNKNGNYNAVIKFAGNSNYKAISQKAKLTIKK